MQVMNLGHGREGLLAVSGRQVLASSSAAKVGQKCLLLSVSVHGRGEGAGR